jgi:hypothetical protein
MAGTEVLFKLLGGIPQGGKARDRLVLLTAVRGERWGSTN